MGRQFGAFVVVVTLYVATAYFFRISVVAKTQFLFEKADALAYLVGVCIALLGGVISRRYGFAATVGLLYLGFGVLAAYFVSRFGDAGLLQTVAANTLNFAASVLTGVAGACVGAFIARRRGSGARLS